MPVEAPPVETNSRNAAHEDFAALELRGARTPGKPDRSDGAGTDGPTAHDATPLPACTGLGEPARLPTAAGPTCAGALAARGHRFVLAVGGDVALRGGLAVELDAGAELDLLVAGRFTASGGGTLGAPASPARVRIWVAGTSSVVLDDQPTLGSVLRAPRAPLSAPAGLSLQGAVLAASVSIGADSTLRFDRAILAAGAACGEPEAELVP